jgi:hypothetical protein
MLSPNVFLSFNLFIYMYLASPNSYIERLAAEEKHIINHSRETYVASALSIGSCHRSVLQRHLEACLFSRSSISSRWPHIYLCAFHKSDLNMGHLCFYPSQIAFFDLPPCHRRSGPCDSDFGVPLSD